MCVDGLVPRLTSGPTGSQLINGLQTRFRPLGLDENSGCLGLDFLFGALWSGATGFMFLDPWRATGQELIETMSGWGRDRIFPARTSAHRCQTIGLAGRYDATTILVRPTRAWTAGCCTSRSLKPVMVGLAHLFCWWVTSPHRRVAFLIASTSGSSAKRGLTPT